MKIRECQPTRRFLISGFVIGIFLLGVVHQTAAMEVNPALDPEEEFVRHHHTLEDFKKKEPAALIRLFEEKGGNRKQALNSNQQKKRASYLKLKKDFLFWEQVVTLAHDLAKNYREANPHASSEALLEMQKEANHLAQSLIVEIEQLQKTYGIHTFPIVHNLFIDVGLKKRGACKHWAEDLLGIIDTVPHPHFTAFWAEAHPGNILEHNVAVLAPRGFPYDAGILIDPWRTAGKPFWIRVKEDNHPWKKWSGYEPR